MSPSKFALLQKKLAGVLVVNHHLSKGTEATNARTHVKGDHILLVQSDDRLPSTLSTSSPPGGALTYATMSTLAPPQIEKNVSPPPGKVASSVLPSPQP